MRIPAAFALVAALSAPAYAEPIDVCEDYNILKAFPACNALINFAGTQPEIKSRAYEARARLNIQQNENEAAISDFTEAIKLAPNQASLYLERAKLRYWGDDEQAIRADFQKALSLSQDEYEIIAFISEMWKSYEPDQALAHLDDALKVKPSDYDLQRVKTNFMLTLKRYDDALAGADGLLKPEYKENKTEVLQMRAKANMGLSSPDAALKDLTEAINLSQEERRKENNNPDEDADGYLYALRAHVYMAMRRYHEAIGDYTRALNDFGDGVWNLMRGQAYLALRDYRKAVDDISKSLEMHPENPLALSLRAMAYDALNEPVLAMQDRAQIPSLISDLLYPPH